VAERRALLGVPEHAPLGGVQVDESQLARAWQQRRPAGQAGQLADLFQLADVAPGEREQERPQCGRRTDPVNRSPIAPCRSIPMPSMQSAPAAIPATRQPAFASANTPGFAMIRTCSRSKAVRPARSASPITGTRPARDTRFGSSNRAEIFGSSYDNRIW
jgi:hypothetical protein